MRDILHEQVSESTDEQLRDRLSVLTSRYGEMGYPLERLAELHAIESEQYCRSHGLKSEPGVTWSQI